jgi:arylsulfate sulfotransferase
MTTSFPTATFSSSVSGTNNPQVANYSLTLPKGAKAKVRFGLTTSYGKETWQVPAPPGGGLVSILVAGMLSESTYHMSALVELEDGTIVFDMDYLFQTGALPLNQMPTLKVTVNRQPCAGVELVNLNPLSPVAADLDGNILWYYVNQTDLAHHGHPMPIKPLPNGNWMVLITNRYTKTPTPYCALREVNLANDTVSNQYGLRELFMADLNEKLKKVPSRYGRIVQVNYFSHDFLPLPNGHVILLCQEFLNVNVGGQETVVWGDALVDLDESFTPVWVWSAFDVLNVQRHPFEWEPDHDWTHCNTVASTPDGNLLLSVRNQSWVLKLHYANGTGTGEILWKLGYEGTFELDSGLANWFFAQHFSHILETSGPNITTMSVVDNGNYRPGTDPPPFSRGLVLTIDESKQTASVKWQYPVSPSFFSYWGGNVVRLPNGNMEICMSRPSPHHSFAVEVTYDQQAVVWQMDISPPFAYRSYRIPSLYPGVTW